MIFSTTGRRALAFGKVGLDTVVLEECCREIGHEGRAVFLLSPKLMTVLEVTHDE